MKLIHRFDTKTKLYVEDAFLPPDVKTNPDDPDVYTLPTNATDIQPVGFHTPKWSGKKWVEDDKAAALALAQEAAMSQLNDEYQTALNGGVTYSGITFQSDKASMDNMNETLTAVSNGWVLPAGFAWVAADNSLHPADLVFLQGLASEFANNKAAAFAAFQASKISVRKATTKAAVLKIVPITSTVI